MFVTFQINRNICFQTMPSQRLDSSGLHLGLPQMRATPSPSPSTIMTLLATYQSMLSHSHQSLNMPPHSVSRSPNYHLQQASFTAICTVRLRQYQSLVPEQHPAMVSMTAPHTGCSPMATALLLFTPTGHDQSVLSMLSQSLVTMYCRSTRIRSLCEHSELIHVDKKTTELNCVLGAEEHSVKWMQS